MNESEQSRPELQALILEWLKAANQFWTGTMQDKGQAASEDEREVHAKGLPNTAYVSMMKTFRAVSTALSEPPALDALFRGTTILPDVITTFLLTGMKGYFTFQQQILDKIERIGNRTDAYRFDQIDQEALRAWSEIYQKEIRQYFNVPQLGLSRFYQERMNQVLDKFNVFNTSLTEFLQLLSLPFEKSFQVMQEKIEELAKNGDLPEDSRAYYRMWVKILEGHFMTLFQSPEYNKVLGETMDALEDYLSARNRVLQDMLQSLPVPTRKEMEDLCKELYLLKKKVRHLEKANEKH